MPNKPRTSTGMTLLRHLVARTRRREKVNPNGIMDITIGDALKISEEFMEMKAQRDEALRILKLRVVPNHEPLLPHTNVIKKPKSKPKPAKVQSHVGGTKIDPRWAKVLENLK